MPWLPEHVFSPGRIGAMKLRYLYLLRGSWPRLVEQAYWPTVQMIIWGFITQFFATNSSWVAQAIGVLLSAVLLWDVLFRAQLGVSVVFMEEMFSRHLGHLFSSSLRPYELMVSGVYQSAEDPDRCRHRGLVGDTPLPLFPIFDGVSAARVLLPVAGKNVGSR